jgi:hypothetical protein
MGFQDLPLNFSHTVGQRHTAKEARMETEFVVFLSKRGLSSEEYAGLSPALKAPIAAAYNPTG